MWLFDLVSTITLESRVGAITKLLALAPRTVQLDMANPLVMLADGAIAADTPPSRALQGLFAASGLGAGSLVLVTTRGMRGSGDPKHLFVSALRDPNPTPAFRGRNGAETLWSGSVLPPIGADLRLDAPDSALGIILGTCARGARSSPSSPASTQWSSSRTGTTRALGSHARCP